MQHEDPSVGTAFDLAAHRMNVAREDLEAAKVNYRSNLLRTANNRAYYSIYHAITAVLALDKVAFKRHKDTIAYFNKEYIKTEIFPRPIGRKINEAEVIRHASDYDEFYIAVKSVTEEQIKTAEELNTLVEKYLQEKGTT